MTTRIKFCNDCLKRIEQDVHNAESIEGEYDILNREPKGECKVGNECYNDDADYKVELTGEIADIHG